MNIAVKVGNPFGTSLNLHISWLWLLPLTAFTLVWYGVSEWLGAITISLMILIHSIALPAFLIVGVFMLAIGWIPFACWVALVVMLLQLMATTEIYGEYQEDLGTEPSAFTQEITYQDWSLPQARPTQKKKNKDNTKRTRKWN